ncbi:MAG: glutathione S-transferase family protein [Pseudomonadota bacterium]
MKLYHAPKAPNPERAVMFLRAKGRLDEVEIEEISIMKGEHKSPEYRALSPMSQVPVLVLDDGRTLTESRAICTYFEALWPDPDLFGKEPFERGEIEMWERRVELLWMLPFAMWFRNAHPAMAPLENPQLPDMAEKSERNARAFVKRFNTHLETHDFVAAGRFSNADISAFITCGFCGVMKWSPHEEYEAIGAWRRRMLDKGFAG